MLVIPALTIQSLSLLILIAAVNLMTMKVAGNSPWGTAVPKLEAAVPEDAIGCA